MSACRKRTSDGITGDVIFEYYMAGAIEATSHVIVPTYMDDDEERFLTLTPGLRRNPEPKLNNLRT